MPNSHTEIIAQIVGWFARLQAAGWSIPGVHKNSDFCAQVTPSDWFAQTQSRPLVVAFIGGTGVGKSSLLNRLAGENIAVVGEQRPTSREVTLFVHESVALASLPPKLQSKDIRVDRHHNSDWRNVVWIDTADIDSTETGNRAVTTACLHYVDLVIYVVSPERYGDAAGLEYLFEHRHRHGWLFVMNHWDDGAECQYEGFVRALNMAGFEQPVVLRTCTSQSVAPAQAADFERILLLIRKLADANAQSTLEDLGVVVRLRELHAVLEKAMTRLGRDELWEELLEQWGSDWRQACRDIAKAREFSARELAGRIAVQFDDARRGRLARMSPHGLFGPQWNSDGAETGVFGELTDMSQDLWDGGSQQRLISTLDQLTVNGNENGACTKRLRSALQVVIDRAPEVVVSHLEASLRQALLRPERRFQDDGTGQTNVPGGLLRSVARVIPLLAHRPLSSAVRASTLAGARSGMQRGLAALEAELKTAAATILDERQELYAQAQALSKRIKPRIAAQSPAGRAEIAQLVCADGQTRLRSGPSGIKAAPEK